AARSSGDQAASRTLIRGVKTVEARWLQSVAARVPQLRDLANLLGQAGIRWSARGYLLITLGSAVGLGFAAFMVLRLWAAAPAPPTAAPRTRSKPRPAHRQPPPSRRALAANDGSPPAAAAGRPQHAAAPPRSRSAEH